MSPHVDPGTGRRRIPPRELGHAGGYAPGPTVIAIAGIHGNEPAGVTALERVLRKIEDERITLRGELVGLAGNLAGLRAGERFVVRDLNRGWTVGAPRVPAPGAPPPAGEDREQRELLEQLERWIAGARGEVVVVDLHTASSRTPPFLVYPDTLRNRAFARAFPIPGILGVEEQLAGTLVEYLGTRGLVAVVVEGGEHRDLGSIENHEAALWVALVAAGALDAGVVPGWERHVARLREAGRAIPSVMEIVHRHAIVPSDDFRMEPGFANFQPVAAGTLLATDRRGEIRAPIATRLFLPLYQERGSEGFFFARPVSRLWLAASAWVRRIGVPRLAPLLPGVRRHPEAPGALLVDRRIARFLAPQVFHLLGFRVTPADGPRMRVDHRTDDPPRDR